MSKFKDCEFVWLLVERRALKEILVKKPDVNKKDWKRFRKCVGNFNERE